MKTGRPRAPRVRRWLPLVVAVLAAALPLAAALATVRGLRWPHDQDLYRDIAQAQVFADGFFADPFYAGEGVWYNPLVPGLFALVSRLASVPVATVATQAGPWLGLAGLVAFGVLARRVFDPWTAALAVAHLALLRDPDRPGWTSAGPTPWAFASSAAQALAWTALLAARRGWLRPCPRRAVLTAAALALAFLAHTAALLVPLAALAIAAVLHPGALRRRLGPLALAAFVAVVVAAPLLVSIAGRYGLHVVNPAPLDWSFEPREALSVNAPLRLLRLVLLAPAALAAVRLLRVARRRFDAALVLGLAAAPLLLLAVPSPVPSFHYVAYAEAAVSLLAAHGLVVLASRTRRRPALVAATALVMAAVAAPTIPRRMDVVWGRTRALELHRDAWQRMREILRASTAPRDVVLASDEMALFVVAPAGRTVVAVEPVFSNPYVDHAARAAARDRAWAALRGRDATAFRAAVAPYGVRYVLASRAERAWVAGAGDLLRPVAEAGGLVLLAVR